MESESESTLIWGAKDSMDCPFTSVCWNDLQHCGSKVREVGAYLAIVQDKAETFGNRLERRVGAWGFFYPPED